MKPSGQIDQGKRRWLVLGVVMVLSIVAGISLYFNHQRAKEPVYDGKRLREWIAELSNAVFLANQNQRAEDAIKGIGTNALPVILEELRLPDDSAFMRKVREACSRSVLGRKGSLIHLSFRPAEYRREQAAEALEALAKPLGVGGLTNLMKDGNPHVQEAAAYALVNNFTVEGVEVQLTMLDSKSVPVRLAALHGLDNGGFIPQKIAPLIRCLADSNPLVRERTVACLNRFSPTYGYYQIQIPGLVEALMRALDDPVAGVRAGAAKSLGDLKPVSPATVSRLEKLATDPDPAVRTAAASALTRMRTPADSASASAK